MMFSNMKNLIIFCPYCNAQYTAEMLADLDTCEGSYTPDCCMSKITGKIDINCNNCHKLIYRKEISKSTTLLDNYDEERWKGFYN